MTPADALPLLIRGYAQPIGEDGEPDMSASPRWKSKRQPLRASDWSIVFDTETTIDPPQRFRVGVYRIYERERLDEERFFFDPAMLTAYETSLLHSYSRGKGLPPPITLAQFRDEVLLQKGYGIGAKIIGFNTPFDISRIALDASPARPTKNRTKFRGGFSFKLSDSP